MAAARQWSKERVKMTEDGGRRTEDGGRRTEDGRRWDGRRWDGGTGDGGRRTEDGGRRTEDGGRETEDGGRETEDGRRRTEDGGRETEDGRRRTEDGGRETEDGGRRTGDGGRETGNSLPGGRHGVPGGAVVSDCAAAPDSRRRPLSRPLPDTGRGAYARTFGVSSIVWRSGGRRLYSSAHLVYSRAPLPLHLSSPALCRSRRLRSDVLLRPPSSVRAPRAHLTARVVRVMLKP